MSISPFASSITPHPEQAGAEPAEVEDDVPAVWWRRRAVLLGGGALALLAAGGGYLLLSPGSGSDPGGLVAGAVPHTSPTTSPTSSPSASSGPAVLAPRNPFVAPAGYQSATGSGTATGSGGSAGSTGSVGSTGSIAAGGSTGSAGPDTSAPVATTAPSPSTVTATVTASPSTVVVPTTISVPTTIAVPTTVTSSVVYLTLLDLQPAPSTTGSFLVNGVPYSAAVGDRFGARQEFSFAAVVTRKTTQRCAQVSYRSHSSTVCPGQQLPLP